ncbi:YidC/Oxa1 family membrane protein insertase [Chloroflexota bacterium]
MALGIAEIWNLIIMEPIINSLIVLYSVLIHSFGLAIIGLTIVIRGVMYPLTVKQLHATKAMQTLQPKLSELQKKYAKDKQKLAQEQMKMYKESGVSPAGCLLPMLIQLPIWIALYWSIIKVLAVVPEDFLGLSKYLYSWPVVYSMLPLGDQFLGLNLAEGGNFGNLVMAILVGGTMWVQQKMVMAPSADPRQRSQSQMMLWMMPLLFAFLTYSFPGGLALYWVTSNVITIVMQYFITGWGGLVSDVTAKQTARDKKYKKRITQVEQSFSEYTDISADIVAPDSTEEEGLGYEESRGESQDRGGGDPTRLRSIKRKPRRGRGHRPKRR